MKPRRRSIPRTLSRRSAVVFYPESGSFHETVSMDVLKPDGTITSTTHVNPKPAGTLDGSTLYIQYNGMRQNAARVAWSHHHGETLPLRTRVRHLDGDVWNNRADNLTIDKPAKHHALTRIAGRVVSLGRYATREEADAAVSAARAAVGAGPVKTRGGMK